MARALLPAAAPQLSGRSTRRNARLPLILRPVIMIPGPRLTGSGGSARPGGTDGAFCQPTRADGIRNSIAAYGVSIRCVYFVGSG
jgi:hypothetical protein